MSIQGDIVDVLTRSEDQLASLLRKALKDREYSNVAELASVSQKVQELIQSMDRGGTASATRSAARTEAISHSEARELIRGQPADNGRLRRRKTYPKFVRDGDRLVKIGWSKRDRTEYVHRAPEFAVSAAVSALRELGEGEFSMDRLTPVRDKHEREVPSYQVYLVMAWLRACGALRKTRRGGYIAIPEGLTAAAVKEYWAKLSEDPGAGGASIDD